MKLPILLSLLTLPASAVVNIDYITVGNAGNAAHPTGLGSVAYTYNIGKYEVTNAQYTEFLNSVDPNGANVNGIYNTNMGSDAHGGISYSVGAASGVKYTVRTSMGDKPVNYVSWYDAARFTNWLHNEQGAGSTETGAYTLVGNTGTPVRNVGATVWLPSESEWFKAAYYDPTPGAGGGDNYWQYATQSDSLPTVATADASGNIINPGANVVNFNSGADWNSQNGNLTTVGSAAANNYFGTFDQGGNVAEWNEKIIHDSTDYRGVRGEDWSGDGYFLQSGSNPNYNGYVPAVENNRIGFRLASAIPEPTTALLAILGLFPLLSRRRK